MKIQGFLASVYCYFNVLYRRNNNKRFHTLLIALLLFTLTLDAQVLTTIAGSSAYSVTVVMAGWQ